MNIEVSLVHQGHASCRKRNMFFDALVRYDLVMGLITINEWGSFLPLYTVSRNILGTLHGKL